MAMARPCVYPNLIAGMAKKQITRRMIAAEVGKTPEQVGNWLAGKGQFPIVAAIKVQTKFFPEIPITTLFELCQVEGCEAKTITT